MTLMRMMIVLITVSSVSIHESLLIRRVLGYWTAVNPFGRLSGAPPPRMFISCGGHWRCV